MAGEGEFACTRGARTRGSETIRSPKGGGQQFSLIRPHSARIWTRIGVVVPLAPLDEAKPSFVLPNGSDSRWKPNSELLEAENGQIVGDPPFDFGLTFLTSLFTP